MKGIIKGSVFSVILAGIIMCICALAIMNVTPPEVILKWIVRVLCGISVFLGSLLVAKSSDNKKLVRGFGCSILSIVMLLIMVWIISGVFPLTGSFCTFVLICMFCGVLGSVVGAIR